MKPYVKACGIVVTVFFQDAAQSQATTAKLEIKVVKRIYGDETPKPFVGVGVFDLLRGRSKLEGASCPDKSGASGAINCSIPCQPKQDTPVTIRVKPPSDQDHLAGWVTPAAQDVELRGCKLVPQLVTMKYDDAKYALNQLIVNKFAAVGAPVDKAPDQWIEVFKSNPTLATKVAAEATESANGRSELLDIYRIASEGSKAYKLPPSKLSANEAEESLTLTKWQILSKSALLGAQVEKTIPTSQRGVIEFKTSTDVATYLANLRKADTLLSDIKEKTPEQLKLADDIKTLQSIPVTGKEAQAAFPIILQWQ